MKTPTCPVCKDSNCTIFKLGLSDGFCWQTDPRNRSFLPHEWPHYKAGYKQGQNEIDHLADEAFQAQYSMDL